MFHRFINAKTATTLLLPLIGFQPENLIPSPVVIKIINFSEQAFFDPSNLFFNFKSSQKVIFITTFMKILKYAEQLVASDFKPTYQRGE
jgi:hypothetical protein